MARTPQAIALGLLLRQARKESGLSLHKLGLMVGRDAPTLSRWESGERVPAPEHAGYVLGALGARRSVFAQAMALARESDGGCWIAASAGEREVQRAARREFERVATRITYVCCEMIPDLLRTPATTAVVLRAEGKSDQEISVGAAAQTERQKVLTRHQAVALTVVLGEAALRQRIGGDAIATAQLEYLAEVARLPDVDLRVLPLEAGWHPGLGGDTAILDSLGLRTALVDNRFVGMWVHRPDDVRGHERDARSVRHRALPPLDSLALIGEVCGVTGLIG
ncbi:helix-turn-helix domain-containing protein [Actinokineospora enzanensis]|uniref:helix-turn-helix domain-containing protein n=1 Tax=Actinokineospora enzanensis TaxID=155975 RepID=UPI00036DEC48|nr:helix-turn-helix transcriptional regulator [Actinokineospora enzanensis]